MNPVIPIPTTPSIATAKNATWAPTLKGAIRNGRWLEKELAHMGRRLIEEYRRNRPQ
jgi:hypothetical protein